MRIFKKASNHLKKKALNHFEKASNYLEIFFKCHTFLKKASPSQKKAVIVEKAS
jgi:hypothetical protein